MVNAALGRFEVTIQAISPPTIKTCGMSREMTISGQLSPVHIWAAVMCSLEALPYMATQRTCSVVVNMQSAVGGYYSDK